MDEIIDVDMQYPEPRFPKCYLCMKKLTLDEKNTDLGICERCFTDRPRRD